MIDLKDVFSEGTLSLPLSVIVEKSAVDINGIANDIEVNCEAANETGIVHLRGTAAFIYNSQCDRCAKDIKKRIKIPIKHILVTTLQNEDNEDYILIPDMKLDLKSLASADVILNFPSKIICKTDCKGICADCGKNLNDESCICEKETDNRLLKLKDFLDK